MPTIEWEGTGFQIHCQIETDGFLHRSMFRVSPYLFRTFSAYMFLNTFVTDNKHKVQKVAKEDVLKLVLKT